MWCFILVVWSASAQQQQRPNILWLVLEDTSPDFIGCYGNEHAKTPTVDALAKSGVRFTNAFSTGSVCSPSRSCIITGVRTAELGTGNHRSEYAIPDSIHGFPYYIRQQGYYTSNNAKTDYNTSAAKRIIKESWNESSNDAGWWKRKPGQPFFSVFNFNESHESRTVTNPYEVYKKQVLDVLPEERKIAAEGLPMPPFLRDTPAMRKQYARIYNSISLADLRMGEILQRLQTEGLMDSTIIFIYADHGEAMPRGKTNGIDRGYRVPFIIWFPEMYQHLSPWGKSGAVTDELISFEDLAPTIINICGGNVPTYLKGRTLIGANRSKPVELLFLSQDRSGESPDLVRSVTDGRYMYSRVFMNFMPEMRYMKYHDYAEIQRLIRVDEAAQKLNAAQKMALLPRPAEYLFDLKNDKWELNNLSVDKKAQPLVQKMRKALEQNILRSRDIHFLPESEMNAINSNEVLYNFRQSPDNYPIHEIYPVAALSGFQGKQIVQLQLNYLKSDNKIIRYWAAMGLRNQRVLTAEALAAVAKSMYDEYAPVQILSATITYDASRSGEAKKILEKYLESDNDFLQVEALQQLAYMNHGRDYLPAIKKVFEQELKGNETVANAAEILLYKLEGRPLEYASFQ